MSLKVEGAYQRAVKTAERASNVLGLPRIVDWKNSMITLEKANSSPEQLTPDVLN